MSKLGNYAEVSCCKVLLIPLVHGEFFLRVDKKETFFFYFLQTCMKSIMKTKYENEKDYGLRGFKERGLSDIRSSHLGLATVVT